MGRRGAIRGQGQTKRPAPEGWPFFRLWWRGRGSNPRPPHCERGALPAELPPHAKPEIIHGRPTLRDPAAPRAPGLTGVNRPPGRNRRMRLQGCLARQQWPCACPFAHNSSSWDSRSAFRPRASSPGTPTRSRRGRRNRPTRASPSWPRIPPPSSTISWPTRRRCSAAWPNGPSSGHSTASGAIRSSPSSPRLHPEFISMGVRDSAGAAGLHLQPEVPSRIRATRAGALVR